MIAHWPLAAGEFDRDDFLVELPAACAALKRW